MPRGIRAASITAMLGVLALTIALAAVVPLAKLFAAPWSLSLEIPWSEPRLFVFLAGTLCGVTVAAGLYPALVAARARRAAASSVHGAGDALARVRTVLVGLQFAAASALVVGAIVLLMQRNELPFALALAATWGLACLAVGACAWRAAKLHPAEALRN